VKYAPKKVFILEKGGYAELSYKEFCLRIETDASFKDKHFIALHGMLMEVSEKDYLDFYKNKRRQKYIDERSTENGDFSYDMLTTDDFNGEDILVDTSEEIDSAVINKIMLDKLNDSIILLSADEQKLIREIFYEELSERTLAEKYGISQVAIHKRKIRILEKLKKIMKI
jgi:RNA polymerase sigma factor (sigma-70 family)